MSEREVANHFYTWHLEIEQLFIRKDLGTLFPKMLFKAHSKQLSQLFDSHQDQQPHLKKSPILKNKRA